MSNHLQRILIALIAIPVIILLCMVGDGYFLVFVVLLSALGLKEFYKLAELKGAKPQVILGIVSGIFINLTFYHVKLRSFIVGYFHSHGYIVPFPTMTQLFFISLVILIVLLCLIELLRNNGSALMNLSITILGLVYVSLFFGTFIGLRELFVPFDFPMMRYFPDVSSYTNPVVMATVYRWGGYTVISIFAMIWICDTAAYYVGTAFGSHKLFPRVSPNKSWEGTIFGFIFALLSAIAAKYLVLDYLSLGSSIIIGMIVGVFGQLGDLIESMFKRDAGVKDSSAIIPGHGGVLDRFDSLLLVSPLVYLYLDFVLFS